MNTTSNYLIIALDSGTTSVRTILFDADFRITMISRKTNPSIYPYQGWVEQDANLIWQNQLETLKEILTQINYSLYPNIYLGITNQRETIILWDKKTGLPIYNAISWQDRRTIELCNKIKNSSEGKWLYNKTGLICDSYFSASKIQWLLQSIPKAQELLSENNLLAGTIDTWLIWKLSNGKLHITDPTNACRTMLYDINTMNWDIELLNYWDIPIEILPKVENNDKIIGSIKLDHHELQIAAIMGDQQASLFGHKAFNTGDTKCTYGTGCFILSNIGNIPLYANNNLLTTIAYKDSQNAFFAFEGALFTAGAALSWLKQVGIFQTDEEIEKYYLAINRNPELQFVPAFAGLGSPHWDAGARAGILGITLDTNKGNLICAALDSIAYQVEDVLQTIKNNRSQELNLFIDGGLININGFAQFQANISEIKVISQAETEVTALGVAYLAALNTKIIKDFDELQSLTQQGKSYYPEVIDNTTQQKYWAKAVERVKEWV